MRSAKTLVVALGGLAMAAAVSAPATVQAAAPYGTAGITSARSCANSADEVCTLGVRNPTQETGGYLSHTSAGFSLPNGSAASLDVNYGAELLPVLRGAVTSAADQRTSASMFGYRMYTWTGTEGIDLTLGGTLHFFSSGDSDAGAGEAFGEGNVFGSLFVADTASFVHDLDSGAALSGLLNIYNCALSCGTRIAEESFTSPNGSSPAGEQTIDFNLATVHLDPGQTYIVGAFLQLTANRGGYVDATHTFTVDYDLDHTVFSASGDRVGVEALRAGISSVVPEPHTWGLMIVGFAGAGAMLRRRRPSVA